MSEETSISATRSIDVPAKDVFELLAFPERHKSFDGSGFIVSAENASQKITKNGQKFVMNMHGEHMGGDYQTDNWVTGFDPYTLISWKTAPAGEEPPGWEWVWYLESTGSDSVEVTLTYRWDQLDPQVARELHMPLVPQKALDESLERLANAVAGED